jgi:hypothetical protein
MLHYGKWMKFTVQLQISGIRFALNQSTQSAALDAKSSSVPVRGAVLLNGAGDMRLVVADGTKAKRLIQTMTRRAGNHLW